MVLQKGRHRFEWRLCDDNGATIAQGNSISIAEARSNGLRARTSQVVEAFAGRLWPVSPLSGRT
jgi:hypothetical protein